MKSLTEIKSMPLVDAQMLIVDLRQNVPNKDKNYPIALQIITAATSRKDWKEPETIEVKNIAGHDVTIDKTTIAADSTGKVYPWQFVAAHRFLEAVDSADASAAYSKHIRKPTAAEETPAALSPDQVKTIVPSIVAEVLKALGKGAAALLAFAFLFLCIGTAKAQQQTYAVGSIPSLYNSLYIANLIGPTNGAGGPSNAWTGTLTFTNTVTNTTTIITNVTPSIVNGTETFSTNYTTNVVVNVPGLVALANYDEAQLYFGFNPLAAAGGVTGGTATWDYSPDGTNWQLNALSMYCVTNALNQVGTNYFFPIGQVPGFIRLDTITFPGTGWGSNVCVQVARKPYRTGP